MGVQIEVLIHGDRIHFPKKGDKVTMNYVGRLENGKVFDDSSKRGEPWTCTIGVGHVIRGWEEGVPQMSLGEKSILTITSDYGYGTDGFPGLIPKDAELIFEIELIAINDVKASNYLAARR